MKRMTEAHAVRVAKPAFQPLLTTKDLETLLRVHRRTISRLCRSGRLPTPIKVGNGNRWRLAEITRALGLPEE